MPSMRDPATGRVVEIPLEQIEQAVRAGYEFDTPAAERSRIAEDVADERTAGTGAGLEALAAGALRGATFGTSDVAAAALGTEDTVQRLAELRRSRPIPSIVGEVAGGVGAALATGGAGTAGALARATPAGAVSQLGARIAGLGEGAIGTIAAGTAAGAAEGAVAGAGNYLTEVALEDKPLSAEGFLAGASRGALWGGAAGGALATGASAFTKARALFPKAAATREAVEATERAAVDEIDSAVRDSDALAAESRRRLDEITALRRAEDPAVDAAIRQVEQAPPVDVGVPPPAPQRDLGPDEIDALISGRGKLRNGRVEVPDAEPVDLTAQLRASLEAPQAARAPRTGAMDPEQARRVAMEKRAKETLAAAKRAREGVPEAAPPAGATRIFKAGDKELRLEVATKPGPGGAAETRVTAYRTLGDGEEVVAGEAAFVHRGDQLRPLDVTVEPALRRRGVASEMYSMAEQSTGRKVIASETQTAEGKAFSEAYRSGRDQGAAGFRDVADDEVISFGKGFGQIDDEASRNAIRSWQTSSAIQKNARTGGEAKAFASGMREQLDKVIASGKLPRDTRLYRGVGPAFDSSFLKPGSAMSSEGFLATSTARDVAETFATLGAPKRGIHGTIFEIDAPAGTPSAWASSRPGEREVLFGRRTPLRVTDVRTEVVDGETFRVVRATVEPTAPAAAPAAAPGAPSRLERELAGTLETVRGGAPLGAAPHIARRQVLDQIDEIVARLDPEAKVLVDANRELDMTARDVRQWVEEMRRRGGARTLSAAPRRNIPGAVESRPSPAKVASEAAPTPAAPAEDAGEAVRQALRAPARDKEDAVRDIAETLGRFEAANANAADALGPRAPTTAANRAAALREAEAKVADSQARHVAEAAAKTERAAAADPSALGRIADLGTAYEVMRAFGVPLPSLSRIPVFGPLLRAYLLARAGSTVFRRLGGKVPLTAEAFIAKGAAATRERVYRAVDSMLEVAPKAARKARDLGAPRWSAVLGAKLFDDGESRREGGTDAELVRHRVDELARAARPGAVEAIIAERFPMADPALTDELAATMKRRLDYLRSHAPLQPTAPTILGGGRSGWEPSKAQITDFARRMEAVDDPAAVLERAAQTGSISVEAADAIRTVYPRLFGEAQLRLIQRAAELRDALPYARRVMLSTLFDVPLDGTTEPEYVAFLQSAYAPAPQPQGPAMGAPPVPTISADVNAGNRATLRMDAPTR